MARSCPQNAGAPRTSGSQTGKFLLIYGSLFLFGAAANTAYHWGSLTHPNLLAAPEDADSWQVHGVGTAHATLRREGGTLRLDIASVDGVAQHLQCFQRGVNLQEGHDYTLKFRSRSDVLRDVQVAALLDQPDYHNVGLKKITPLLPVWQTFTYTFRVTHPLTNDTSVPCFMLGNKSGTVWLADVSVTEVRRHRG